MVMFADVFLMFTYVNPSCLLQRMQCSPAHHKCASEKGKCE